MVKIKRVGLLDNGDLIKWSVERISFQVNMLLEVIDNKNDTMYLELAQAKLSIICDPSMQRTDECKHALLFSRVIQVV